MDKFNEIIGMLTGLIWGPWIIVTIVGIGIYFTFRTKFLQVRKFPFVMKNTLGSIFKKAKDLKGEGTLTPFQAVTTALASTVGVGNIVGVATALVLGGPGAIFWMWVSAFFGMATKFAEIVLSIFYREKNEDGEFVGGPAFYMKKGLNSKLLGGIFTVALALACIGGNMVQSNALVSNLLEIVDLNTYVIGGLLVLLVGVVSLGGIKRLGAVTEKLVPVMAILYVLGGTVVLLANVTSIPNSLMLIVTGAFKPVAFGGGAVGVAASTAIRFGVARGLYSNEAGQGTAPIAHAAAKTDHPVRQGLWGITEVFIDTFVICTFTALVIMTSGISVVSDSPAILTSLAFGTVSPLLKYVVSITIILFAYSTIVTLGYYGESVFNYIGGAKLGKIYRYIYIPFTFIGAIGGLNMIWSILDLLLGIAVVPNLIAIVLLSPKVIELTKDFFGNKDNLLSVKEDAI